MIFSEDHIPSDAVLLIPEREQEWASAPFGIEPGYYNSEQLLQLLAQHKQNADAIHFIADMLETGDSEVDAFARLLRIHGSNPVEINRIIKLSV